VRFEYLGKLNERDSGKDELQIGKDQSQRLSGKFDIGMRKMSSIYFSASACSSCFPLMLKSTQIGT
jgi:hypothetical protein